MFQPKLGWGCSDVFEKCHNCYNSVTEAKAKIGKARKMLKKLKS
jgi:hypothetical protein